MVAERLTNMTRSMPSCGRLVGDNCFGKLRVMFRDVNFANEFLRLWSLKFITVSFPESIGLSFAHHGQTYKRLLFTTCIFSF
jgi:hypothetical protein